MTEDAKQDEEQSKKAARLARKLAHKSTKRDLTFADIAELTGFSRRYIEKLVKDGLPKSARKSRHGKPRYFFNADETLRWLASRGILTPEVKADAAKEVAAATVAGLKEALDGETPDKVDLPKEKKEEPLDRELLQKPGLIGALERLKLQEYNCSRLLVKHMNADSPSETIQSIQRLHSKIVLALRHAELGALEYGKREGQLFEFEPAARQWERIMVGIKNAVMGIGTKGTPLVRQYLKDPERDSPEVMKVLQEVARQALVSLPNEIPLGNDSENTGRPRTESAA